MRFRYIILSSFVICHLSFPLLAQSRIGEWSEELPFAKAVDLVEARNQIYCATQSGLFSYNLTTEEIIKWSKVNGLSDVDISCIAYSHDHNLIIIAYSNSNIDLLRNNKITNIPAVKRKQITGNKRINSIHVIGDNALLSCGFGIIKLDLVKKEVSSTYYIGPDGRHIEVFETILFNYDSIFAATEMGIYKAALDDPNLENFRIWKPVTGQPFPNGVYTDLAYYEGMLWASHRSTSEGADSIYTYNGHRWSWFPWYFKDIRKMHFQRDNLIVISEFQINVFDTQGNRRYHMADYGYQWMSAYDVLMDENDGFWLGDQVNGLLYTSDRENFRKVRPDGPWDRKNFHLVVSGSDLWIASGGYDASWNNIWNNSGVSARINGSWKVFNPTVTSNMGEIRDIIFLAVDPLDPDHLYGASWGNGIVEFKDGEYVGLWDDNNTDGALQNIYPGNPYTRIGGLAFDSKNNLWVSNSSVPNPISVKKTDGTWKSFSYGQLLGDAFTGNLVITPGDIKWVQLPKGFGLLVFDNGKDLDDATDDKIKKLTVNVLYPRGTVKILNDIYSMAVDLDGKLWLGTSNGVVVYYAPYRVFDAGNFYGTQPPVNQGDSLYHALLGTETVTCIAVDGANRKWFGTKNSGVFLTNPDGTELISSFNILNSPLLSNNISSIAIDQNTGEVYFGTEAGVVSYRGTATRAPEPGEEVYAFPNPVRPGFTGMITIRGVPVNSTIKITDTAGGLVYETESTGGQATWNGNDLSGAPVRSGVYLVFAHSSYDTRVTKILIVR